METLAKLIGLVVFLGVVYLFMKETSVGQNILKKLKARFKK